MGESGPPCGVPSSTGLTKPSSISPPLRNARMSLSTRIGHSRGDARHQAIVIESVEEFFEIEIEIDDDVVALAT